jgi:hypothetical protein
MRKTRKKSNNEMRAMLIREVNKNRGGITIENIMTMTK